MIREAKLTRKLVIYENSEPYLRNANPRVQLQVLSKNVIKIGKKIEIKNKDLVILTARFRTGEILISVSEYRGFEIFDERYFEIVPSDELGKIERFISEDEFPYDRHTLQIIKRNVAVLTSASA